MPRPIHASRAKRPLRFILRKTVRGKLEELVECPFCLREVWTFALSRCGTGKRCTCNALLGRSFALKEES